jgi:hypothetical protein
MFFDRPTIRSLLNTSVIAEIPQELNSPVETIRPTAIDIRLQKMKLVLISILSPLFRTPGNRTERYSCMFPLTTANMDLHMRNITASSTSIFENHVMNFEMEKDGGLETYFGLKTID